VWHRGVVQSGSRTRRACAFGYEVEFDDRDTLSSMKSHELTSILPNTGLYWKVSGNTRELVDLSQSSSDSIDESDSLPTDTSQRHTQNQQRKQPKKKQQNNHRKQYKLRNQPTADVPSSPNLSNLPQQQSQNEHQREQQLEQEQNQPQQQEQQTSNCDLSSPNLLNLSQQTQNEQEREQQHEEQCEALLQGVKRVELRRFQHQPRHEQQEHPVDSDEQSSSDSDSDEFSSSSPRYFSDQTSTSSTDSQDDETITISFADIITKQTPILKRIPKFAREDFAKALSQLLNAIYLKNDHAAWLSYFMFAPVVLLPPPRGGQANFAYSSKWTLDRIQQWIGAHGETDEHKLYNRAKMFLALPTYSSRSPNSDVVKRVKSLMSEGRFSLACNALAGVEPMAPMNDATMNVLRAKHPNSDHSMRIPMAKHLPPIPSVSAADVEKAIRSFPIGSGSGPSKLRPDHIRDAFDSHLQVPLLDPFTKVISLLASGRAFVGAQPFIAGAFLTPLIKRLGGIRPVASGDVVRRVTAKVLLRSVNDTARDLLFPSQLGVAVRNGLEATVHSWRELMHKHKNDPNICALKIDLDNAFNQVSRNAMLDEVLEHFPDLYRFAWFLYGQSSRLFFRNSEDFLYSSMGTQQGCPLGSLLFCLVLRRVTDRISELFPNLSLNAWYIDDGSIIGDCNDVRKVIDVINEMGSNLGISINMSKCELIWTTGQPPAINPFSDINITTLPDANCSILGVPIGDAAYCDKWVLDNAVEKARALVSNLSLLSGNSQLCYLLLRFCLSFSKMVFYIRNTPVGSLFLSPMTFDSVIKNAFLANFPFNLSNDATTQLQLRIANGGLGLRKSNLHHPAAFYSSLGTSLPLIADIIRQDAPYSLSLLDKAKAKCSESLPEGFQFNCYQQAYYSRAIDDYQKKKLFDSMSTSDQARMQSVSAPHASAFLSVPPIVRLGWNLSPEIWNIAVGYRLGVQFFNAPFLCPQPACSETMDKFGLHAMRCGGGNCLKARHNLLRDFFFSVSQKAAMSPVLEPQHLMPGNMKPADWACPNFDDGKTLVCDVGITDPLQDAMIAQSASTPCYAADAYAKKKRAKYNDLLADSSIVFKAVIVETLGAWNGDAKYVIADLGKKLSQRKFGRTVNECVNYIYNSASIILQRSNARILLSRMPLGSAITDYYIDNTDDLI
jgi:hypothetical protein